jgi:predicted PurR-regulated permease PerM
LPNAAVSQQNRLLIRAVFLLWILAIALLVTFCYFASSLCITLLIASFLAIVVDPVIVLTERWHIPRTLSAALVILGGTAIIGLMAYASYNKVSGVVDDLPVYARRVGQAVAPLTKKIQKVEDSAGRLNSSPAPRRVPEVKIRDTYPEWTSYIVRGVGPLSGIVLILAVVPFLMFFLLIQKERLKQKLSIVWGEKIDVSVLVTGVTDMVRGFVVGNLIIGMISAVVTMIVLIVLHVQGAILLGAVSGMFNLIPFVGAILASIVPMAAALIQDLPISTLVIIFVTVVALHTIAQNLLVPRLIGGRVSISPVAATLGILFWGWLWGLIGIVLAVPLTALVKLIADANPHLSKISNLLAEKPKAVPPWSRATGKPGNLGTQQPAPEVHR